MSAHIDKQMADLRALRESIRAAEATLAISEPMDLAFVAPLPLEEARLTSNCDTFSASHLSTVD
jgi:hypothetical protein